MYSLEKTLMLREIESVSHQAPLSMGFPRQENWNGPPFPSPEKDWRQEEKETTEDEMVGWHHGLNRREFEQVLGVDDGQGNLARCRPWDHKESDTMEWLNWTESEVGLIFTIRTTKWLISWLEGDGEDMTKLRWVVCVPKDLLSSSKFLELFKRWLQGSKRGRPEAQPIPAVLWVWSCFLDQTGSHGNPYSNLGKQTTSWLENLHCLPREVWA